MAAKISSCEFLKLICVAGGASILARFMKLGEVFGANVTSTNATDILDIESKVGFDGVSFLYPTKPGGFVWYMNPDKPFNSHLEIGGSTYEKLVKNKDGSWKPNSDGKVKFNILSLPGKKML